jgi:hypothetical protein
MSDTNLFSFNGPDDNGKTVALGDVDAGGPTPSGGRYSTALKFSTALQDLKLVASGTVTGGKDACVDVNNYCRNLDITIAQAKATGQFVATVKGSSDQVTIRGMILARGTVCEVILGDWSDQSHARDTNVCLDLKMIDGSPVRVIVLASDFPVEMAGSGPYRYLFIKPWFPEWLHWLIVFGFETLRRWGLFRSQAN